MSLPWEAVGMRIRTVNGRHIVAQTWETGQKDSAVIAEHDAKFIVTACNAYHQLVAERDALRAEVTRLRKRVDRQNDLAAGIQ